MKAKNHRLIPCRRAVEKMRAYHPPLEGRTGKLRLDFNENTGGCSPSVKRALERLSTDEVGMYPEQETVRRELARHFRVTPDELLLTNGTDEALHLIANTYIERRDRVLIVEPTFAMYRFYAELAGATLEALRYDDRMGFPMSAVISTLAKKPRVLFLANPNNPTGSVLDTVELRSILRAAPRTLVVIDEAYFEYCGVTVLSWIRRHTNLVVTRTFSKAAGMAGLRLGCIFTNRSNAATMRKAASPYPVNVAALAAARACVGDSAFLRSALREFAKSRDELRAGLTRLGLTVFPSAANFMLIDLGDRAKPVVAALGRKGILIRDRSSDFGGRGYVRITVGTKAETGRVLRALKEVL